MSSIKPTIYLTPAVKEKLDLYIEHSNTEISGVGNISINNNTLLIDEIYLLEQKNTAVNTDIDSEVFSKFCTELVKERKSIEGLKFWWHSHVNMNTFWSAQDEQAIETLETDFLVSIVGNKKGDYLGRIDTFVPYRSSIDDIPIKVLSSSDLVDQIKKEISEKTIQTTHYYNKWNTSHFNKKNDKKDDRYLMNSLLEDHDNFFQMHGHDRYDPLFDEPDNDIKCTSLADLARPAPGSALEKMDKMTSYKSGKVEDKGRKKPSVKSMNRRVW